MLLSWAPPAEMYQRFLAALSEFLCGAWDSTKYEDECRQLMGTGSYLLFTLDRVINHAVKQLQTLATEAIARKLRVRTCACSS